MSLDSMLGAVLDRCAAEGVTVVLVGGKLIIAGEQTALDEWRPLLRSLKPELIEMMTRTTAGTQRRATAFTARGVEAGAAYALARRLDVRDARHDERRLCLECVHFLGTTDACRCAQWRQARLGGPQLPRELPVILQRCRAFQPADLDRAPAPIPPAPRRTYARPATYFEGATQ
ncbi:hypothetical protein [Massilia sp. TN1-12]|uniref:hypothetical protein n=1 Tax=Massilia paldalensis TaxID=3377675 RepID=UPI00384B601D